MLLETDDVLDRTQALFFRARGLRAPVDGWQSGQYVGTATHLRDGMPLSRSNVEITLP